MTLKSFLQILEIILYFTSKSRIITSSSQVSSGLSKLAQDGSRIYATVISLLGIFVVVCLLKVSVADWLSCTALQRRRSIPEEATALEDW